MFRNIADYGDKIAIVDKESNLVTYSELLKIGESNFQQLLTKRQLIFIHCSNNVETLALYVYCILNNITTLLLPPNCPDKYLKELLDIYKPTYIWFDASNLPNFELENELSINFDQNFLVVTKNKVFLNESLAILLTTSGTTGNPSLVRLSHSNLDSNAEAITKVLDINQKDVVITTLPFSYSYGLSIINTHLMAGATIVLNDLAVTQKEFWEVVERHKVTTLNGVPFQIEAISRFSEEKFTNLSIRKITQAGGKLGISTALRVNKLCKSNNINFYIMYGQTEATARMSVLKPEFINDFPGSIGKPIPGGKFILKDSQGDNINVSGVEGVLYYSGPNVCLGYAQNHDDLSLGDVNNGILNTGDIAFKDENEFFYITGREKRIVKIYGYRMNLDDIEHQFKSISVDLRLIEFGDKLIIFTPDRTILNEIHSFVRMELRLTANEYRILELTEIPRNANGKTDYAALRKIYESLN